MEDFKKREVIEKLQVIIMAQIGKGPLNGFRSLSSGERKRFNLALNEYIRTFLSEDWELKLQADFNTICIDDIFNEKFKAEQNMFGCQIDTDIKELRAEVIDISSEMEDFKKEIL
jgi:hypothetical protein